MASFFGRIGSFLAPFASKIGGFLSGAANGIKNFFTGASGAASKAVADGAAATAGAQSLIGKVGSGRYLSDAASFGSSAFPAGL